MLSLHLTCALVCHYDLKNVLLTQKVGRALFLSNVFEISCRFLPHVFSVLAQAPSVRSSHT